MSSSIDRYKKDFERLRSQSALIKQSFKHYAFGKRYESVVLESYEGNKEAAKAHLDSLPDFRKSYQSWYSECIVLLKQLLPERLSDFIRLYEKPKGRKDIDFESYRIEDALQGLRRMHRSDDFMQEIIAEPAYAMPHIEQQIAILDSLEGRFDSSLYDIRQLVQSDFLDSELDAARELLKHKFARAAGVIAGVVLEKHLFEVCRNRSVNVARKHPAISGLNDVLRDSGVIDTPSWRFNQHLADLRNLCAHDGRIEPTCGQVRDLIEGVARVVKTVF